MEITKREKEYEIRSYDADMLGNIRLTTLIHFLQDMADIHAAEYNIGFEYCHTQNIAWILSNYHLKINTIPKWTEKITIRTWPSSIRKIASIRDFIVENSEKNVLITASSQWVTIDLATRRPVPILTHIPHFQCLDERALDTSFPKILDPDKKIIPNIRKFDVYFNDIDVNGHVNNSVYFFWIIESFDLEWLKKHELKEIEVSYKNETYLNETIQVATFIDNLSVIQIITAQDHRELARISTYWESKE